jgi:DNA-binding transcriptional MerR regulator
MKDVGVMGETGFSGTQTAKVVGITYRQLDYWARTDLIRPSMSDASGSGSRRLYSYSDLVELRVIKTLLDAGIKLESVREVFRYLREHLSEDIASAHLVISGTSVVLCQGEELIDVLNRGQGVLNVLSLRGLRDDLDTQLIPLRSAHDTSTTVLQETHPEGSAEMVTEDVSAVAALPLAR